MEKDYEILWTDLALEELSETVEYIERKFTQKEIDRLGNEIERISSIISRNPTIFPFSDKLQTRKVVILKLNTLYYRIMNETVEIISFFSNRQNPEKRKI
ncbi:MAG: type II toxin-antitoxin system RelE/ParE family toxin [Bacteroidetes bacterium]|nr:type II toxin-antitoxin system RelE/ParE family toxin [Bacteroidota bacterium]